MVIGGGVTAFVTFGLKGGVDAQQELAEKSKGGWNGDLKGGIGAVRPKVPEKKKAPAKK